MSAYHHQKPTVINLNTDTFTFLTPHTVPHKLPKSTKLKKQPTAMKPFVLGDTGSINFVLCAIQDFFALVKIIIMYYNTCWD